MRFPRALIPVVVIAVATIVVPSAKALGFDDRVCPFQPPNVLRICPNGTIGVPYSLQLYGRAGTGCVPFVKFSLLSGDLPPGLTLSSTGLISGTPTENGTYLSWLSMYDIPASSGGVYWCADSKSTERQFSITIGAGNALTPQPPPPIAIEQSTLTPSATVVEQPYRVQLSATGGGSQTWTLESGTLPTGLTLSSGGLLSGTPSAPGSFTFDVQVSDGSRSDTRSYTLVVVTPLKIAEPTVPAAEVGEAFRLQLAASGGQGAYRWSAQQLPSGLGLDPTTGALTGQPATDGSFPLVLTVTDSLGFTNTINVTLPVAGKLATDERVFAPRLEQLFRGYLLTSGGIAPTTWEIAGGKLPIGIRLVPATGELVGRPLRARTSTLLVQAKDALGAVAEAKVLLTVVP
jgi:hypothetical protein